MKGVKKEVRRGRICGLEILLLKQGGGGIKESQLLERGLAKKLLQKSRRKGEDRSELGPWKQGGKEEETKTE